MVIGDSVLISLVLVATGIAAIHDLKTKEVPDWLSYGLLFGALGVRLLTAVSTQVGSYLWWGLLSGLIMYGVGWILFRTKQWGGGDAKLLVGVGVAFGTRPWFIGESFTPFMLLVLISIFMVGAVWGLLWSIGLAIRHRKKFNKIAKELLRTKGMLVMRGICTFFAIAIIVSSFIVPEKSLQLSVQIIALVIISYPYLLVLVRGVEKVCFYKYIQVNKLVEGDWVEQNVIHKGKTLYKKKNIGIETADILRLKKAKIKQVLVKEGIPFVPTFFFATVLTLLLGYLRII